MPLTISNLDNAQLAGQAQFQKFHRRFQDAFYRPMTEAQIVMAMQMLPPEVRTQLEQLAPAAMKNIQDRIIPRGSK